MCLKLWKIVVLRIHTILLDEIAWGNSAESHQSTKAQTHTHIQMPCWKKSARTGTINETQCAAEERKKFQISWKKYQIFAILRYVMFRHYSRSVCFFLPLKSTFYRHHIFFTVEIPAAWTLDTPPPLEQKATQREKKVHSWNSIFSLCLLYFRAHVSIINKFRLS